MQIIDRELIDRVLAISASHVSSLYMPTHRQSPPSYLTEDTARYKNLLKKVKNEVPERDFELIRSLPAFERLLHLREETDFWADRREGLAIFAAGETLITVDLPASCSEYVAIGNTARVLPLLVLHSYNQAYNLLAVAAHEPVLYSGDMYGLKHSDIDLPISPEEALQLDELFSQSNTVRRVTGSGINLSPRGRGDVKEAGKEERLKFFRLIDHTLLTGNRIDPSLPLLLAGTEEDVADYKSVSRYPQVMDAYVNGNHTETSSGELHRLAWPLIESGRINGDITRLEETIRENLGTGLASNDVEVIKRAAVEGRVDSLLVGIWQSRQADANTSAASRYLDFPAEFDFIDKIAREVDENGGLVAGSETDSRLSALFRY